MSSQKRLLLGVIDNLRNIILILTNAELMLLSNGGNDFLYNEKYNNKNVSKYFDLIKKYQDLINKICFFNIEKDLVNTIRDICNSILCLENQTFNKTSKLKDNFLIGKCYNILREIDNYFENYIVCNYIVKNNYIKSKSINLISILYGGLELPFIIRSISKYNLNISFMFQNLGMYINKQTKDKNVINEEMLMYGSIDKNSNTFIIDDNMMSGITIQFNYNKLFSNGFNNIKGIFFL